MHGYFNPTMIGYFYATLGGRFRPTLTTERNALFAELLISGRQKALPPFLRTSYFAFFNYNCFCEISMV